MSEVEKKEEVKIEDWVERLYAETQGVATNIVALNDFIYGNEKFKGLSLLEQFLMKQQLAHMEAYYETLRFRLIISVNVDKKAEIIRNFDEEIGPHYRKIMGYEKA